LLLKKIRFSFVKNQNPFILFSFLTGKRRIQLFLILSLSIISSILEVFSVGAIIPLLTILVSGDKSDLIIQLKNLITSIGLPSDSFAEIIFFTFVSLVIISTFIRLLLIITQTNLSYAIGADLSWMTFQSSISQKLDYHLNENSSHLIGVVTSKTNQVVGKFILPTMLIVSSFLTLLFVCGFLFFLDPALLTLVIFIFSLTYFFSLWLTGKKLMNNSENIDKRTNEVIKIVQEALGNIRDIILYNDHKSYVSSFIKSDKKLRKAQSSSLILSSFPRYIIEGVAVLIFALYIGYEGSWGSESQEKFQEIIPILGALTLAALRILPLVQQIYSSFTFIRSGRAIVDDVLQILFLPPRAKDETIKTRESAFKKEIILDEVTFGYISRDSVIESLSLIIKKRQKVGILGETGSGKSTIVDLIMGLLEPSKGKIFIDDKELNTISQTMIATLFSHVPQKIFLIDSTIRENITLGKGQPIDESLIFKILNTVQLADFITELKDGLDTRVGEQGVQLSGGQAQRIGLARALYRQSEILVLDEATSAIDDGTEKKILNALRNNYPDLTIISISHRSSSFNEFDRVLRIDNGKIIDEK